MSNIDVAAKREVGGTVTVKYDFTASRFGRPDGAKQMVLSPLTYPSQLGRRYLTMSQRRTPLVMSSTEATHMRTTVKLPKGWSLSGPVPEIKLAGPVGKFIRTEAQKDDVLVIDETLLVPQSRISPKQYPDFGQFAGEVDLVQGRDLLLEKK